MTDYNDGRWHGWNGGECPVHPESLIDHVWHDDKTGRVGIAENRLAATAAWGHTLKFRVVTPYVEPQTYTGKCWAYHYTSSCPTTVQSSVGGNRVPGKWAAEHVNGKLRRFSWEADE